MPGVERGDIASALQALMGGYDFRGDVEAYHKLSLGEKARMVGGTLRKKMSTMFQGERSILLLKPLGSEGYPNSSSELSAETVDIGHAEKAAEFFGAVGSVANRDMDLSELKPIHEGFGPKDQIALRQLTFPFLWQGESGGEIKEAKAGVYDFVAEDVDYRTVMLAELLQSRGSFGHTDSFIHLFNMTMRRAMGMPFLRFGRDPVGAAQAVNTFCKARLEISDDEIRNDLVNSLGRVPSPQELDGAVENAYVANTGLPVNTVRHLREVLSVPSPHWTSLISFKDNANLPVLATPFGESQTQGRFIGAFESVEFDGMAWANLTGEYPAMRQAPKPWILQQGLRGFFTVENYQRDYATLHYLMLDSLRVSFELYTSLLMRMLPEGTEWVEKDLESAIGNLGLPNDAATAKIEQCKRALRETLFIPLAKDDSAIHVLVSRYGANPDQFRDQLSRTDLKSVGSEEVGNEYVPIPTKIGNPFGTWRAIAAEAVRLSPGRFDGIDFEPFLKKVGLKDSYLSNLRQAGLTTGDRGFVTFMDLSGARIIDTKPFFKERLQRNYAHYAKYVELILGQLPKALKKGVQERLDPTDVRLMVDTARREVVPTWKRENLGMALMRVESNTDKRALEISQIIAARDRQDEIWKQAEIPVTIEYIKSSLIAMIEANFVYNLNARVLPEQQLVRDQLSKLYPSAGLIMRPDWNDFCENQGKQFRPEWVKYDSSNLSLMAIGCYPMFDGKGFHWNTPTRQQFREFVIPTRFVDEYVESSDKSRNQTRVNEALAFQREKLFSPCWLYSDVAMPASAFVDVLNYLQDEDTGFGTALRGSLSDIERFCRLSTAAGYLPEAFSTVTPSILSMGEQKFARSYLIEIAGNPAHRLYNKTLSARIKLCYPYSPADTLTPGLLRGLKKQR